MAKSKLGASYAGAGGINPSGVSVHRLIGSKLKVADLTNSPKRIQWPRSQMIENTLQR